MNKKPHNPIVLVDFDGVIHSYTSGWQGADIIPDPPVPGAIEFLVKHLPIPEPICAMAEPYKGPEVQIYSSRSSRSGGIKAMQEWLVKHGLSKYYITEGILKFPKEKNAAFLTIDDRAICFDGRWPTTVEMLSFRPWNKRVDQSQGMGATGMFPQGKMDQTDEGEIKLAIAHDATNVLIKFGKPVAWLGLSPKEALQFAGLIEQHARALIN